ncbi:MAG TPA: restriction endonuclease [Chloroflexi bacterium]|nr:restriction endonuclease [Chloroflexota bacterium]
MKSFQDRKTLSLTEYVTQAFPRQEIPETLGEALWRDYGSKVTVEFPSPKTGYQWELTARGWVGYIPLAPDLGFSLQPKVSLGNLFRMLEYAYRLQSFEFLDDLVGCQSLEAFYERLANVLAKRVLDRARKGFYRAYLPENERLPYVRGRLDVRHVMQKPWSAKLHCHYEEHTPDVEENQILAWTLGCIARSHMCSRRVQPTVRRAYQSLRGVALPQSFSPQDCVGRLYNRLNDDYHPMHALCRFFLEHSGPTHEMGDRTVLPFLVNMARLFELFVAEWLKAHLPPGFSLRAQEKVDIGEGDVLSFTIDLVLCSEETGEVVCVLDTKYKDAAKPSADDVTQVVAYAEMKGCQSAVLIYPIQLSKPLNERVGSIQVRSLTFSLEGELDDAGKTFVYQLLSDVRGVV